MKKSSLFVYVVLLLCLCAYSQDSSEKLWEIFLKLEATTFADVNCLSAVFSQQERIAHTQITREKSGSIKAERSGRFRMAYREPEPIDILFDGQKLYQHFVADNDLQVRAATERDMAANPFFILFHPERIKESFYLDSVEKKDNLFVLRLRERDEASAIASLDVQVDMLSGFVTAMTIYGTEGNVTAMTFSNPRIYTCTQGEFSWQKGEQSPDPGDFFAD